jgi:hypothetical protein
MSKRFTPPQRVYGTFEIPRSKPTGNAFRLEGRPAMRPGERSYFDANSPVYTSAAPICSVIGKGGGERCPVQQFFVDGQAKLRFCSTRGEKGRVIPIGNDFVKANATAQRLCKCWKASSPDPEKRSFDGCRGLTNAPLGGLEGTRRKAKRRKR